MNNREAFEAEVKKIGILTSFDRNNDGTYKFALMQYLSAIWQAALASQAQQTPLVVWGYAWQCKSVGDWRIEKLGEGCIHPKDTIALYTAPEGGDK